MVAGLVSKVTEDTACLYPRNVSLTYFEAFLLMVSVSMYLQDTEDTAPRVSVAVSKVSSPTLNGSEFKHTLKFPTMVSVCNRENVLLA